MVGERAYRIGALLRRDAGREGVPHVDRDREAVSSGASLSATIGSSRRRLASSAESGAHTMPDVWRMMKAVLAIVVVGDYDDLAAWDRYF